MCTRKFLRKLFLSDLVQIPQNHNVLVHQMENFKDVWFNRGLGKSEAIGIERLLKLLLILIQFLSLSIYVRMLFANSEPIKKHFAIEVYIGLKVIISSVIVFTKLYEYWPILLIAILWIIESVTYTANLILNQGVFAAPHSYKRNLILTFVAYIQMNIDYAAVYLHYDALKFNSEAVTKVIEPIQAIYFSFITSFTVGYGEIIPSGDFAYKLVISQILTFLLFGILVINFYSTQVASQSNTKIEDSINELNALLEKVNTSLNNPKL